MTHYADFGRKVARQSLIHRKLIFGLLLSALFYLVTPLTQPAYAQSCVFADIVNESAMELDTAAICEAARPWAEDGYALLIYLTDDVPDDEAAWFDQLDRVEASVGMRDLSEIDAFNTNVLALEASTNAEWATALTLGDRFLGSALDSNAASDRIKRQIQVGIASGDASSGFVNALDTAYALLNPVSEQPQIVATPVPEEVESGNSAESNNTTGLIVGSLAIVALGGGALWYANPRYIQPALATRKKRQAMQTQLDLLQQRVANLLLGSERLLGGEQPQETVLYQLFEAYGGHKYDPLNKEVTEWLRRSQAALADAFDIRTRLVRPGVAEERSLEQQVSDWEKIYVTIVGTSERIAALSDDELHTLLDPLQILESKPDDVQLVQQLDAIRADLTPDPLRVELIMVDPESLDAEGILGYLDQVQQQIGRLQAAERQAPEALNALRQHRQESKEEVPSHFIIEDQLLFGGIDARLNLAQTLLDEGVYLRVLEETEEIGQDLDTVDELVATFAAQTERDGQIEAIEDRGFRPKQLEALRRELADDVSKIRGKLQNDNFDSVRTWIDEYNADGEQALQHATDWERLYTQNSEQLTQLRSQLTELQALQRDKAASSWQKLQAYPALNWQDLKTATNTAIDVLENASARLLQTKWLNTMDDQQFDEAERNLTALAADFAVAGLNLDNVVARLAAVNSAEANIDTGIELTERELIRAEQFRNQENRKIGIEVDQQLNDARKHLEKASAHRASREFLAALSEQEKAREIATAANRAASEQVARINSLQQELETLVNENETEIGRILHTVNSLSPVVLSATTVELTRNAKTQQAAAQAARTSAAGKEDHHLATALTTAIDAYRATHTLVRKAETQSEDDSRAYDELYVSAEQTIAAAAQSIENATITGRQRDSGSSWRDLVKKAQRTLPRSVSRSMTQEQLRNTLNAAQTAQKLALKAQSHAEENVRAAQRRRLARGTWHASSGSFNRPSSRPRSSARRSSSSFRSSSRRSSSSRSMGSSSRRSSRGSSRRR
jgi:hypothetical protein